MEIIRHRHSCIQVKTNSLNILIDPANKLFDFNFDYSLLGKIDYVLLTHAHKDHINDIDVILAHNSKVKIYAIHETINLLLQNPKYNPSNFIAFGIGSEIRLNQEVVAKTIFANHSNSYDLNYAGVACGFLIQKQDKIVFISGDTSYEHQFMMLSKRFNINLLITPFDAKFNLSCSDVKNLMLNYFKNSLYMPYHLEILEDNEQEKMMDYLVKNNVNIHTSSKIVL